MGIKIFNSLPFHIKDMCHVIKQFKLVLRTFIYSNYFYFNYNSIYDLGWLHKIFPFIITLLVTFHYI
jgi:hypothetical protein